MGKYIQTKNTNGIYYLIDREEKYIKSTSTTIYPDVEIVDKSEITATLGGPLYKCTESSDVSIDPKQEQAVKKLNFDSVPITLRVLAAPASKSGADKYGRWNWLKLEDGSMSLSTYLNALDRHLTLFRAGQDYTSDTNIHNLDSMIAGLAVVRDAMVFGKINDDRVKLSEEQINTLEKLINQE